MVGCRPWEPEVPGSNPGGPIGEISMRRRLLTKKGLLRLLSDLEGVYWVEFEKDELVIRKIWLTGKGILGKELDDELVNYLIARGATL